MVPFDRTVCACPADVAFCKRRPGHLIPADVPRLARYLLDAGRIEQESDVIRFLRASGGAMVIRRRRGTDEFVIDRIPTIAPRSTDDGRCVFLTADERCSVHPVAPFGCSFFDAHMPGPEGDRRSQWGLVQIERSEAYAALRRELAEIEEPAVAFTAVLADQGWGLGVAEAGVAGYTPVQTTTWPTFEAAEKVAESLNTKLGLTREAAWRIVGSSMAAGRAK